MLQPHQIEELICVVSAMDRRTIIDHCMSFRGSFPVDFTAEFLHGLPLERLRHVFVALCLQCNHIPSACASTCAA